MKKRRELIKKLLEIIKEDAFVKGYEPSDVEVMSILVSSYFEWDGAKIADSMILALDDANFHTLAEKIQELVNKEMK